MTSRHGAALAALALATVLAGCQQPAPSDLTLQRGSQLLAAGSPKSAIPFLTQVIASAPDGPEPMALLALAYALDMQGDRAIAQARQVRLYPDAPPGWETVAVGIAEMLGHHPAEAEAALQQVVDRACPDRPIGQAARQWLVLAQVLNADHDQAITSLASLAESAPMKSTAMLWAVLIHSYGGRTKQAAEALSQCAAAVAPRNEPPSAGDLAGQALYDSAVAMTAAGDLETASSRFLRLQEGGALGDTPVWLALLPAARGDWWAARDMLKQASQSGPLCSRGLANQLFSVICALEDRPDAMIEHMLAGQRMLARHPTPAYVVEHPKPEIVWFSNGRR